MPPLVTAPLSSTIFFHSRRSSDAHSFLSQRFLNEFTAPITEGGGSDQIFSSAEQYLLYRKAMLFNDPKTANAILEEKNQDKQKKLGREVRKFNEETWAEKREKIAEECNWYKFTNSTGHNLGEKLLATGNSELVKAAQFDRIWGIGYPVRNAEQNRENWGLNLTGKALMRVRSRLAKAFNDAGRERHVHNVESDEFPIESSTANSINNFEILFVKLKSLQHACQLQSTIPAIAEARKQIVGEAVEEATRVLTLLQVESAMGMPGNTLLALKIRPLFNVIRRALERPMESRAALWPEIEAAADDVVEFLNERVKAEEEVIFGKRL